MISRQFPTQMLCFLISGAFGLAAVFVVAHNQMRPASATPPASPEIAAAKQAALAAEMAITDNRDGLAPATLPDWALDGVDVLWYAPDGHNYSLCATADGKTASYDSRTGQAVSGPCADDKPLPAR